MWRGCWLFHYTCYSISCSFFSISCVLCVWLLPSIFSLSHFLSNCVRLSGFDILQLVSRAMGSQFCFCVRFTLFLHVIFLFFLSFKVLFCALKDLLLRQLMIQYHKNTGVQALFLKISYFCAKSGSQASFDKILILKLLC